MSKLLLANIQASPYAYLLRPCTEQMLNCACADAGDIAQVSLKDCVRVATVDNFQGEESTIIILSLVRNNK